MVALLNSTEQTGSCVATLINSEKPAGEYKTYQIDGNSVTGGLYTIKATSEIYTTDFGGGGTINLTELTSDRMKGTFSFTVSPMFATHTDENTNEITEGEFDIAIL